MWLKWLPWRYIIRKTARAHGFLDPILLWSHLSRFAQPSEVTAPVELLRSGAVLHARGLINSQVIQHNLDWVWPYWVNKQFDPQSSSFIPRGFAISHVNLTHRNWTAVGIPECEEMPIVDPRGLLTPFFDSWSVDVWVLTDEGRFFLPSKTEEIKQTLLFDKDLTVFTQAAYGDIVFESRAFVVEEDKKPVCRLHVSAKAGKKGWIIFSLRPYNPEGISFIHDISILDSKNGWRINEKNTAMFSEPFHQHIFSDYRSGDVFRKILFEDRKKQISCDVGMATAAGLFRTGNNGWKDITLSIPLKKTDTLSDTPLQKDRKSVISGWENTLREASSLNIPDSRFQFLYDAALRTAVLHSPKDVYPGPFTYKKFWFRDAAYIVYALLLTGFFKKAKTVLDRFSLRQKASGFFQSQNGEWDSNGQALWIMSKYCQLSGKKPDPDWYSPVKKAGNWIQKKRFSAKSDLLHAGLMPAGFSAEHFGPNDFYYWDDFWSYAGLKAAGELMEYFHDSKQSRIFHKNAEDLLQHIEKSLEKVSRIIGRPAMPVSPYRRLDSAVIGSIAAGYPLKIFSPEDPRLVDSAAFLLNNYLVHGGLFHDVTHSGINPYLTLHLAQVLMRAGKLDFYPLMQSVADLASETGQWPEAIHPLTKGGCMGDGQHVWAAAEWIIVMRNALMREEENKLILCSGISLNHFNEHDVYSVESAPTRFGKISVSVKAEAEKIIISLKAEDSGKKPDSEICFPGHRKISFPRDRSSIELRKKELK